MQVLKKILKGSVGFNAGLLYGSIVSTLTSIIVLTSLGSHVGFDANKYLMIQECLIEKMEQKEIESNNGSERFGETILDYSETGQQMPEH